MNERMLNKKIIPTIDEMSQYCGSTAELFASLNEWLSFEFQTKQEIKFPYGNDYGWCITHRIKKTLICNVFAENNSFTVMIRLSNKQFDSIYEDTYSYMQECIDNKYSCNDGGWIHYRITCKEHIDDIKKLLSIKCGL
ncbi:MAG: DUF3788 domain-containing protein [Coprobacillus sp.]